MSPTPLFSLCFEIFIKCVLRIHRVCFDHVTLFQLLPDPLLPFWSTQLCVFFSFKSTKQSLCCPHILECVAIHQGRVNLTGARTLKKADSSSPWSYQLFLSHGWAVVHTFPLHGGRWSFWAFMGLVYAVTTVAGSYVLLLCCVQKTLFLSGHLQRLSLTIFLSLLLQ